MKKDSFKVYIKRKTWVYTFVISENLYKSATMNMTTVRKASAGAYIFKDKRDFSLEAQDCWYKVALAVKVSEVSQLSGLFPF